MGSWTLLYHHCKRSRDEKVKVLISALLEVGAEELIPSANYTNYKASEPAAQVRFPALVDREELLRILMENKRGG